jgi:YgiT-type zinc finger domain-containing protein
MERRLVATENRWGEELALVEGVPAWVCQDCGDESFDAPTSRQLDRLRAAPPPARKTVAVPVYAFADATPARGGIGPPTRTPTARRT